jgi:hypothetical protein
VLRLLSPFVNLDSTKQKITINRLRAIGEFMPNQWTSQNQKDWDAQQAQGEEEEIEETTNLVLINTGNDEKRSFTARDIITAMIGNGWKDFTVLYKELENIGFNNVMVISFDDMKAILEEMENDEIVSIYWDTERVGRNL